MKWDRREFVFSLAVMAASPPGRLLGQARGNPEGTAGELTGEEREILGHLCDQIVPADDFPGARELGVAGFLERVLLEAHPEWLQVYRAGLRSTDRSSREHFGSAFPKLASDKQLELLQRMERGELPSPEWTAPGQADFFSMVRSHTMQGYYGHPRWGGNRDKAAWKMIGYDDWWV